MEKLYLMPDIKSYSKEEFTELMGPAQTQYGPGPSLYFQEVGPNNNSVPAQYTQLRVNYPEIYRVV